MEYNQRLTSKLESINFKVFLPQRDGAELDKSPFQEMTVFKRNQTIFELDIEQVLYCNIFLFVLDGRVPDEGSCFELGVAYNQKRQKNSEKQILGLHTDMRASFIDSKLNAMIGVPFDEIFKSEKELIDYLNKINNRSDKKALT